MCNKIPHTGDTDFLDQCGYSHQYHKGQQFPESVINKRKCLFLLFAFKSTYFVHILKKIAHACLLASSTFRSSWGEGWPARGLETQDLRANERPQRKLHREGTTFNIKHSTHTVADIATTRLTRIRGASQGKLPTPQSCVKFYAYSISEQIWIQEILFLLLSNSE